MRSDLRGSAVYMNQRSVPWGLTSHCFLFHLPFTKDGALLDRGQTFSFMFTGNFVMACQINCDFTESGKLFGHIYVLLVDGLVCAYIGITTIIPLCTKQLNCYCTNLWIKNTSTLLHKALSPWHHLILS